MALTASGPGPLTQNVDWGEFARRIGLSQQQQPGAAQQPQPQAAAPQAQAPQQPAWLQKALLPMLGGAAIGTAIGSGSTAPILAAGSGYLQGAETRRRRAFDEEQERQRAEQEKRESEIQMRIMERSFSPTYSLGEKGLTVSNLTEEQLRDPAFREMRESYAPEETFTAGGLEFPRTPEGEAAAMEWLDRLDQRENRSALERARAQSDIAVSQAGRIAQIRAQYGQDAEGNPLGKLPVTAQNAIASIPAARDAMRRYQDASRRFTELGRLGGAAANVGLGNQGALAEVRATRANLTLMLKEVLKLGVLNPADRVIIQELVGVVESPEAIFRGDAYTSKLLSEADRALENIVHGLEASYPGVPIPEGREGRAPAAAGPGAADEPQSDNPYLQLAPQVQRARPPSQEEEDPVGTSNRLIYGR